MIVQKLKRVHLSLWVLLCLTVLLSSCSPIIEFSTSGMVYEGEVYDFCFIPPSYSNWYPLPSSDQCEMVGRTPFFPIGATSYDPVMATNETPANFLIICADGKAEVSKNSGFGFIRSGIELASVFETAFADIDVIYGEYGNDIPKNKISYEFSAGTTFDDIVGEMPYVLYTKPNDWDYYCTLRCTHPEINYLVCDFVVITANDNLYLRVTTETNEDIYYLLNFQQN